MKPGNSVTSTADVLTLPLSVDSGMLRRAGLVALVLGSILTLVNQADAIFGGATFDYLQLALVYILPFALVTISQALGAQKAIMDARLYGGHGLGKETLLDTVLGHGIPLRALIVGAMAGSINASIGLTAALLDGASLGSLPLAPFAQAYALPIIFGLLSQAITYRRATQTFRGEKQWTR